MRKYYLLNIAQVFVMNVEKQSGKKIEFSKMSAKNGCFDQGNRGKIAVFIREIMEKIREISAGTLSCIAEHTVTTACRI